MAERTRFDMNMPGAAALRDKIVHGAFKTEGQMVAFPLCFPSVSIPIPADESKVTALDVTADGVIYGGTSGYLSHLFVAMFHGVTGMVLDMGAVENCTRTAAVCCGNTEFFAAVNGTNQGHIIVRELQETPFSLIQEWTIQRTPYTEVEFPRKNEPILHAVSSRDLKSVIGTTESCLFKYDFSSRSVDVIDELQTSGRLGSLADGTIIGRSEETLWRYDPERGSLSLGAAELPPGNWTHSMIWAEDRDAGICYTADADARLFSFSVDRGFSGPVAEIPYAPVTSMAVTFDGRVFGSCGTDMQRMFCYDPEDGKVTDIGVAASTLQQRRYCYEFGDAVTGRDGEIIFGEDDDLGHLWLYFPRIKRTKR